jgi:bacillithiol synthase
MAAYPMECHCIRAIDVPHTSRLYSSYVQDFPSVSEFYGHPPTFEAIKRVAAQVRFDANLRRQATEILREQNRRIGADASVEKSLDRLAEGAVAIVSGQQVGLFSGPSYTFYKALTALRLADDLTAAGTPAVAVFWLATEDHDLAEVNHCFWPSRAGEEKFELSPSGPDGGHVGSLRLGEQVSELVERAVSRLEGLAAREVAEVLSDSYRPEETYGSAFGKLMTRLFAGRGLILLDPLSREMHRLAEPLYGAALERHDELTQALLARGKALERANYHVQVKVTERNTLLFVTVDGKRLPLRARGAEFLLGRRTFALSELKELLASSPESFSANVLLRPIVQDTLLPTAAYVAGPAEIAYFAQASVNYQRLLGRMPAIVPRASFSLVDSHAVRLLRKYALEFSDVLRGRAHLRERMEAALLPQTLTRRFGTGEKTLRKLLSTLREPVTRVDKTLAGAVDSAEKKMLYQFSKLRGKAARAVAFRSGVLDAHERELTGLLYPNGALQERSLCFLPILAQQGLGLLDELARRIDDGGPQQQHQVLYL